METDARFCPTHLLLQRLIYVIIVCRGIIADRVRLREQKKVIPPSMSLFLGSTKLTCLQPDRLH